MNRCTSLLLPWLALMSQALPAASQQDHEELSRQGRYAEALHSVDAVIDADSYVSPMLLRQRSNCETEGSCLSLW